jgi:hypothetical protein
MPGPLNSAVSKAGRRVASTVAKKVTPGLGGFERGGFDEAIFKVIDRMKKQRASVPTAEDIFQLESLAKTPAHKRQLDSILGRQMGGRSAGPGAPGQLELMFDLDNKPLTGNTSKIIDDGGFSDRNVFDSNFGMARGEEQRADDIMKQLGLQMDEAEVMTPPTPSPLASAVTKAPTPTPKVQGRTNAVPFTGGTGTWGKLGKGAAATGALTGGALALANRNRMGGQELPDPGSPNYSDREAGMPDLDSLLAMDVAAPKARSVRSGGGGVARKKPSGLSGVNGQTDITSMLGGFGAPEVDFEQMVANMPEMQKRYPVAEAKPKGGGFGDMLKKIGPILAAIVAGRMIK